MATLDSKRLDNRDKFPAFEFTLADGRRLRVPEEFDQPFQVVLFYRGYWCPYCQAQLKSYQAGLQELRAEGIGVVAASVDSEEHCAATVNTLGLTFPVAHSLPVMEAAQATGAFFDSTRPNTEPYLQATGFLLDSDRRVLVAVYSSSAIGRLTWQDVLGMVRYLKTKNAS